MSAAADIQQGLLWRAFATEKSPEMALQMENWIKTARNKDLLDMLRVIGNGCSNTDDGTLEKTPVYQPVFMDVINHAWERVLKMPANKRNYQCAGNSAKGCRVYSILSTLQENGAEDAALYDKIFTQLEQDIRVERNGSILGEYKAILVEFSISRYPPWDLAKRCKALAESI